MKATFLVTLFLWQLCVSAEFLQTGTRKVPGIIKPNNRNGHAKKKSANTLGAGLQKSKGGERSSGSVNALSLFGRQTCPPGFELCPELFCCEIGTTCCPDGCCPLETPFCAGPDYCCELAGTVECGPIDPTHCHEPDTVCCGAGITCDLGDTCCLTGCCDAGALCCGAGCCDLGSSCCGVGCCDAGTSCCSDDACCSEEANDENSQCCPGTENGGVCCGQHEVCCDGWCCFEGSTCDAEFGYCQLPLFGYAYDPTSTSAGFLKNACVGMQRQVALGVPGATANSQVLTYAGPGVDNRKYNLCGKGGCCTNLTVPAGQPGAGDPMSCEEYPFNSAEEGGASAVCSCISEYVNSAAGNQLGALLAGRHKGFKYIFYITGVDCTQFSEADLNKCLTAP